MKYLKLFEQYSLRENRNNDYNFKVVSCGQGRLKDAIRNHGFIFNRLQIDSSLPLVEDIKDMCLEMMDDGFSIEIYKSISESETEWLVSLCIFRNPNLGTQPTEDDEFDYEDISEDVERIKGYLVSNGNEVRSVDEWDEKSTSGIYWSPYYDGSSHIKGLKIEFTL